MPSPEMKFISERGVLRNSLSVGVFKFSVQLWFVVDNNLLSVVNADGTGELDEEAVPMKAVPTYSEHRKQFQDIERVGATPPSVPYSDLLINSQTVFSG